MRTWSKPNLIIENWFWVQWCAPAKIQIFLSFFLLIEFCQIKQKVKNGSCSRHSCVNQDDLNECMIYHMKVHIFSYNLGPKKFSKSRICILPNYEQTDSKTAIVYLSEYAANLGRVKSDQRLGSQFLQPCLIDSRFQRAQRVPFKSRNWLENKK